MEVADAEADAVNVDDVGRQEAAGADADAPAVDIPMDVGEPSGLQLEPIEEPPAPRG